MATARMGEPTVPATLELTDVAYFSAKSEPTPASVSYQLAHDTARELEVIGNFAVAAEMLAVALAEEAQRTNQRILSSLDLVTQPEEFRSLNISMAGQQNLATTLRVPRLEAQSPPIFARYLAMLAQMPPPPRMPPRPSRVLFAIARRWYLPRESVAGMWADFVKASGGTFTLSLPRARQTLLAAQPEDVAQALWEFAMLDPAKAQLMSFADSAAGIKSVTSDSSLGHAVGRDAGHRGQQNPFEAAVSTAEAAFATAESVFLAAAEDAADGVAAGGAGGLNFEEYVVLRSFATSTTLEAQFRFLWRLFDRDADGSLSRADLSAVLQIQRVRLGWDDITTQRWLDWVHTAIGRDERGHLGPAELKAALLQSAQLRALLLASDPAARSDSRASVEVSAARSSGAALQAMTDKLSDSVVAMVSVVTKARA